MTTNPTSRPFRASTEGAVVAARPPRLMTLAEFRRRYSNREDGFKYEFNKGIIEKTQNKMRITQYHIVKNLTRHFVKTEAYKNGSELAIEVEQLTGREQVRRPDLCLVPAQKLTAKDETISGFAIEITSPTDRLEDIQRKRREYFRAGVQVVWQIDPTDQSVSVYTSPVDVKICEGAAVCSAAPALPDFEMTAEQIFQEP